MGDGVEGGRASGGMLHVTNWPQPSIIWCAMRCGDLSSSPAEFSQVKTAEYFGRIAKGVEGIEEEVRVPYCVPPHPLQDVC